LGELVQRQIAASVVGATNRNASQALAVNY